MQLVRKIVKILFWIIIPITIIVSGIITQQKYFNTQISDVDIDIDYKVKGDLNRFLTYEDINNFITTHYDSLRGNTIKNIDLEILQNDLIELPYIKDANAYTTMQGELKLQILQRRAIIRVIDNENNNYYLDDVGRIIPIKTKYPARVPVCNGTIPNIGFYTHNYSNKQLDSIVDNTILKDIFAIAKYIDNDTLMNMQIAQINIDINGEYTLVPLVSHHLIEFGKAEDIERKFRKLKIFYKKGLGHHKWDKYKKISLKYKNQIVCTKY
ncbi:MAG: hypothetical protein KAG84_01365 [Bacteroidales bacterium]|nr:hypothetical protein [Bacteroidales bacterium]